MPKKSHQEWILNAQRVHKGRYTYNKTEIRRCSDKVVITCPEHGDFSQVLQNHVHKGHGCPKCSDTNRFLKPGDWLERCKSVHGDRYDYSQCCTSSGGDVVTIICREHGPFTQLLGNHARGQGCLECAHDRKRSNTAEWVGKAKKVHGGLYSYADAVYSGVGNKVIILCQQHGPFQQMAQSHLQGYGCSRCRHRVSKPSIEWLTEMAKLDKTYIQHGGNGGEVRIAGTRWHADGFSADLNKVYEFHGNYYHGNPRKYAADTFNKTCKCTMGELYEKTRKRRLAIEDLGYDYEEIWEDELGAARTLLSLKTLVT